MNEEIKEIKIGMYSTDEILEFMTNGEGRGFMGRSIYDAIIDYITNLQQENKILNNRINKAIELVNEMLERAYINGEYILYDYSTSEILEIKEALNGGDEQ